MTVIYWLAQSFYQYNYVMLIRVVWMNKHVISRVHIYLYRTWGDPLSEIAAVVIFTDGLAADDDESDGVGWLSLCGDCTCTFFASSNEVMWTS